MQFADILICMDDSPPGRTRTELALALAARSGARVVGYYSPWRPDTPRDAAATQQRTAEDAAVEFERQLKTMSLEGMWVLGGARGGEDDIVKYAMCADLVVVGLGIPDDPASNPPGINVEQIVVGCGRPVLGMPIVSVGPDVGRKILIAWDGSRESTRALHDAVPFLREAETVTLASIAGDTLSARSPNGVIAHLKRLGVSATIDTEMDLQLPIGEEILSRIEREEIDLLVAGAFGHSRLREHLLGGVSTTLLHQMMVPVLVSH